MGRLIESLVVGFSCQLRSCGAVAKTLPLPISTVWRDQIYDLAQLVESGWSFVLTPRVRSYCADHVLQVYDCTCKTHPERRHLCVQHEPLALARVWHADKVPHDVSAELKRYAHV